MSAATSSSHFCGRRVLVTGAAGFIGSAVTRALVAEGAEVVAMLQPGARTDSLTGLAVERVVADLGDKAALRRAVDGARTIFHLAALYRFWAPRPRQFYEVNVEGTRRVLEAAADAGCERIVYTSSVGTLGLAERGRGGPSDETSYVRLDGLRGLYHQSKYVAEHEVLRAAAAGLPVCLVLPAMPLGPGDHGPTPTGRIVLDFLNGRMPGYVDTALDVVDVDDVASGHLLAAEHGVVGRSYILAGEHLELRELLGQLARCTGLPEPRWRMPTGLAVVSAHLSELLEGRLLGREPHVPLEGARMARTRMLFSDARARAELGYKSRPAAEAIERSARWFADNGYVVARRLEKVRWVPASG